MKIIGTILLILLFVGCASTVGHLQTPSGRPEIFIQETTSEDVTNTCVSFLTANGWRIEQTTDYMVQAILPCKNTAMNFLYSTRHDRSGEGTWWRIIITLVRESKGVRMYGEQQFVSNRGTSFENRIPFNNQKAYENTQNILKRISQEIHPLEDEPQVRNNPWRKKNKYVACL